MGSMMMEIDCAGYDLGSGLGYRLEVTPWLLRRGGRGAVGACVQ